MSDAPKGLRELEQVMERLAGRANLDFRPEQIAAYAKHFYEGGEPLEGDPGTDPMQWAALAAAEDYRTPPEQLPAEIFGHQIRGEDLAPIPENIKKLRDEQWGTWAGPGWSQQDLDQLGRPRNPGELSPGDMLNHQWMRDHQYLYDILTRRTDNMKGLEPGVAGPMMDALTGPSSETPESIEARNLDDALHWYRKGAGATHYFGDGKPGDIPFYNWAGANFKEYGTDEGVFAAMNNNDYLFGYLNNNVFSPMEEALNSQTMRNLDGEDNTGIFTPVVTPVYDFFKNALFADGKPSGNEVSEQRQTAKQIYSPSPKVPHPSRNPTRDERIDAINRARSALGKTENMSGDDYQFARTSKDQSYLGKFGMTFGSSLIGDPTVYLSGLAGGLRSPRAFFKGFRNQIGQEAAETAGFNSISGVLPLGQTEYTDDDGNKKTKDLHTPHVSTWWDPTAQRTDLPNEDPAERIKRIQRQERDRELGLYNLEQLNSSLPKERVGPTARKVNGLPEY